MTELINVKTTKGKFFITVLFVVIVVGLFIAAYIVPQRNAIKKLETDLKSVEDELKAASGKIKELEVLKKDWPIVKEERKALASLIPDNHKETDLVEFLHYLATLYSIDIEQIDMNEPAALPLVNISDDKKTEQEKSLDNKLVRSIKRLSTTMRIGGKFNDVLAFLDGIKMSNRYFMISKVGIVEEDTARKLPDGLPMVLDGEFYFYSSELSDTKGKKGAFEQMVESEGLGDKYLGDDSSKTSKSGTGTTPKKKVSPEEDIDNWIAESGSEDSTKTDANATSDTSSKSDSRESTDNNNSSDASKTDENAGTIDDNGDGTTTAKWEGAAVGGMVQSLRFDNSSFVERLLCRALSDIALGVSA
jgi:hypothetical protein